jgi:hypothetical protein
MYGPAVNIESSPDKRISYVKKMCNLVVCGSFGKKVGHGLLGRGKMEK